MNFLGAVPPRANAAAPRPTNQRFLAREFVVEARSPNGWAIGLPCLEMEIQQLSLRAHFRTANRFRSVQCLLGDTSRFSQFS
jgi:hypothetical protein